jgi:hypothetical protein
MQVSFLERSFLRVFLFLEGKFLITYNSSLFPEYERLSLREKRARNEFLRTFEKVRECIL